MYAWECECMDCGHVWEYEGFSAPYECEECQSDQIARTYLGRSY